MKVTVKILQGKQCVVDILPSETVLELKHKVSALLGIDVPQQKLLLTGKTLDDHNPLSFYPGIKDGSKLNLIIKKSYPVPEVLKSMHLLKTEMTRVLRRYYTESESELIADDIIEDLKSKVENCSYDDFERLATALMQDQDLK